MNAATLEMTIRCRRKWLIPPTVRCAGFCHAFVSPRLGNAVVNAGLWLSRWEYRIGNGRWRRIPTHVEVRDDDNDEGGTPIWSVVSGVIP